MKESQQSGKGEQRIEIIWVNYVCSNPLCVDSASPRPDHRNFERAPIPSNAKIPETIPCTTCGGTMIRQG